MTASVHDRFRELISERLDGPLAVAEAAELESHLERCSACRRTDRDYRAQRSGLGRLRQIEPPRDLWARTAVALDHEVTRTLPLPRVTPAVRRAAIATAVSGLLVALIVTVPLVPSTTTGPGSAPTPYAVEPADLVYAAQSSEGELSILRTTVDEVCPAPLADCTEDRGSESVASLAGYADTTGFAIDPSGRQAVLIGVDSRGHANYDIVVLHEETAPTVQPPPTEPGETSTGAPTGTAPTATPDITSPPPAETSPPPTSGAPPTDPPATDGPPSADPTRAPPTNAPPTDGAPTDALPTEDTSEPPATGEPSIMASVTPESTPSDVATPTAEVTVPPSPSDPVVPRRETRSILTDVTVAGMPAAWSSDGSALAFSARPADGSAGPDIYIWRRGDETATAITRDGRSYFASWAGNRIVGSRAASPEAAGGGTARGRRVTAESFVLDLETREERRLRLPRAWLPVVDPTGRHAVSWRGRLTIVAGVAVPESGRLYLESWTAQDPFAEPPEAGTEEDATATPELTPTPLPSGVSPPTSALGFPSQPATASPSADPRRALGGSEGIDLATVREWEVRWAHDGSALGVWVAERPGARSGRLAVVAIEERAERQPELSVVMGPERAWRAFSVGVDRVAYVAPDDDARAGELRVATWGSEGQGLVRIRRVLPGEALPAF